MNSVSGSIMIGEQQARLTHVYSRRRDGRDGPTTAVLFSSAPLPERALEDRSRLTELARQGSFLGLALELAPGGKLSHSEIFYDKGAFSGSWQYEPGNASNDVVTGRVATKGDKEFFGRRYVVDVSFQLTPPAQAAWGGSPFYRPAATGLSAGRAEGWLETGGTRTELTHAVMLVKTDLFSSSGERSVLLSSQPVTDDMLSARGGPEQKLHDAGIAFMRAHLDATGEVQSLLVPAKDGQIMSVSTNRSMIELAEVSASTVDGYMKATESGGFGSAPRFELRFHAPARTIGAPAPVTAENGQPLPADGGEPGKAYLQFADALKKAQTIDELLPYRSAASAAEVAAVPVERRAAMLGFLKQRASSPLKIVGGFANDTQATLWLEGTQSGERTAGRVNVHREDGVWKLGAEAHRVGSNSL